MVKNDDTSSALKPSSGSLKFNNPREDTAKVTNVFRAFWYVNSSPEGANPVYELLF